MTIHAQRGFSLVEQMIALAALVVVAGAAVVLMGSTERARRVAQPAAELVWTRATAAQELAFCESAAADLAYFDLTATIAAVKSGAGGPGGGRPGGDPGGGRPGGDPGGGRPGGDPGGGRPGGGPKKSGEAAGPSGPPAGYCGPVVLSNPATYPPGFDPRDRSTWAAVPWWSGADSADPSTWYYACSTPGPARRLAPVYSFGDGVVFAGGDTGASVDVCGPAAVVPDSAPIYADQSGDALVMLRTQAGLPRLALGGDFVTSASSIRFVASDQATREAIESLAAGDVLVVTGPVATGEIRTAVAELRSTPAPVLVSSPLDTAGQPILRYYEAAVTSSTETVRWGLRNQSPAAAGISIGQAASVAVLDRTGGTVVFYTASGKNGSQFVKLRTGAGGGHGVQTGTDRQVLVDGAAAALRAEVRTATVGTGSDARQVAAALTVAMPIAGEPGEPNAEPLSATIAFTSAALTNSSVGFTHGTITEDVSFPPTIFVDGGLGEVPDLPGGEQ